ncbi:hypothetical protein GCM10011344_32460 [Dokdonia pacifica]|uniref:YdhG-like domain-containing protein n=1 Tax=Dokdonia pacifica TaxID=1627892 RepID=A0A239BJZ1_9FLAO|nr:hypothetical protein [Dokdonia pacifica]GGG29122.1 hypothetical protein GCM10011344_32460 [Dokdonia pacifica]SNS07942.1 hypothetical protein SAMN06265376_106219 [Dokdonia pacifica]
MITDPKEIDQILRTIIKEHVGPLQIRKDEANVLEAAGTIPTMQGKQKVDGFYFASVMPKPKDVRLYFFPIYTDATVFKDIDPMLRKCLKGKSCFHIKKMDDDLKTHITKMIALGIKTYQDKELLTT